ncbi:Taurine catabolism dioxygenase TauD, TfdA family [Caballeronia hypogeia]|uniref:Taurine catabolism dioxygenase TauD, TfdA family n=1 Tax=Caballeronia hypogeia TaxID=1777140 RepID=A0A158DB77_9BURK|nr:TauD/TfdA family dioxygenase [Caballeronia hypogeia]SAK91743.1 Taurine catabolism dioxygenase TauD, TfdA family [Caballeronia hypogeia]
MSSAEYLQGACVWHGADMQTSPRWVKHFPAAVLDEIDTAVHKASDIDWQDVNRDNFPLPSAAPFFDDVRAELENGSGMVKIVGLDVGRYDAEQLRRIWYALGRHLGTPMFQNRRGELMREIKDEGAGVGAKLYGATVDASGKEFLSSGARTLSPGELRFHTDRCDVVGLLCVRQASEGGVSKLASSATVYNEMLKRRPDLHSLLCRPIPRSRFGEEAGGQYVSYDLPVFGVREGKLTSHFSLTYIENAQLLPGVRRLSDAEHEALRLLLQLAQEHCFEMRFAPGDIQLLNNHIVYHGRTAFKDDASTGQDRMLMRLWLSVPNSRALPEDHAILWGDVASGMPHGGIAQPATPCTV